MPTDYSHYKILILLCVYAVGYICSIVLGGRILIIFHTDFDMMKCHMTIVCHWPLSHA